MKNKIKIIVGYLLGFVCTILLVILTLLGIIQMSLYNRSYVNKMLNQNNYYEKLSLDIKEEMENYMVSSGFPFEILDNIYTIDDIKKDVNLYFDYFYLGKVMIVDKDKVTNKLNDNINSYLNKSNLLITNQEDVKAFVDDIVSIYEKEVTLYHTFDRFLPKIVSLENYLNKGIVFVSLLLCIVCIILISKIKFINYGTYLLAASLILLFLRFVIVEKVDIMGILLITEHFSDILSMLLLNIRHLMLVDSIVFGIVGIVTLYVSSKKLNKKKY